jgi:uncharacterized protein (TIGR00645 family)
MDRLIEELILGLRWLLLPLYFALFAVVFGIYAMVAKDLWHLAADFSTFHDTDLVLLLCDVLDLVLVANLLVMVAVSSYESYLSRITTPVTRSPEWLGKLDSGNVKVKVAIAVVMTSMIHLHRARQLSIVGNVAGSRLRNSHAGRPDRARGWQTGQQSCRRYKDEVAYGVSGYGHFVSPLVYTRGTPGGSRLDVGRVHVSGLRMTLTLPGEFCPVGDTLCRLTKKTGGRGYLGLPSQNTGPSDA